MKKVSKQLAHLRAIEPTTQWSNQQWDRLVHAIGEPETSSLTFAQKVSSVLTSSLLRPLGNVAIALIVVAAGSWATVTSAQYSLPGSPLHTLKIALEDLNILFSMDDASRVQKQTRRVENRVNELKAMSVTYNRATALPLTLNRTVKNITKDLAEVSIQLDVAHDVSESTDAHDSISIARTVDEHAEQLTQSLDQASKLLPEHAEQELSQELAAAMVLARSTSDRALGVIIDNIASGLVQESEIIAKLSERYALVQEEFAAIDATGYEQAIAIARDDEQLDEALQAAYEQVLVTFDSKYQAVVDSMDQFQSLMETKNYVQAHAMVIDIRNQVTVLAQHTKAGSAVAVTALLEAEAAAADTSEADTEAGVEHEATVPDTSDQSVVQSTDDAGDTILEE